VKNVYLPMPVSFEVKRDWNKKGFRVLDLSFIPAGYDNPADGKPEPKKQTKKQSAE
jgi:hypothetical protein